MAFIWSGVKALIHDVNPNAQLEGYESVMDFLWTESRVNNLVEDVSALVQTGDFQRAYKREHVMEGLISAVAQGVVILQGPPGSGKTALFEELAFRICNHQIPSFNGWKVFRLKLKQLKGDSSVEGVMNRLLEGGPNNRMELLLKHVQKKHAEGKPCIIFIDEIQDLLEHNITLFDGFKEDLGRSKLHIIGATTNKEIIDKLRQRGGTGAGMLRRIGIIELQEMTSNETQAIIAQQSFFHNTYSGCRVTYKLTENFTISIVSLAKTQYPDKIFPDCAVSLFSAVKRFYLDKHANLDEDTEIVLDSQDVFDYLSTISKRSKEFFNYQVKKQTDTVNFQTGFKDNFFPSLQRSSVQSAWIQPEAARLKLFFGKRTASPFLFLRGESDYVLTHIVTASAQQEEVFCCDVEKLVQQANNRTDVRKLMSDTLQHSISGHSKPPLLILKNFNPQWVSTPIPPTPQTTTAALPQTINSTQVGQMVQGALAHAVKNTSVGQILNHVSSALIEPSVTEPISQTPSNPTLPTPIVEELLQLVEQNRIPTVAFLTPDAHLSRSGWTLFDTAPLSLNQTINWLSTLFPSKNQFIFSIFTASYYLKDIYVQLSPIELTVQALTVIKEDPAQAMFEALVGSKSYIEIQKALEKAAHGVSEKPWVEISKKEALHYSVPSQTFPDVSPQSILWISEHSHRRREWISFQMAGALPALPCFWYQSSPIWREMPEPLKEQLLQQFFQTEESDRVIFIADADLKDLTLQKMLQKNPSRVVGFYSPQSTPTMDSPPSNMILEQGKKILKNLTSQPGLAPIPDLNYQFLYYAPPALTTEERNKLFSQALESVPGNIQPSILSLYLLLFEKSNSLDLTLLRLEHDLEILKEKSIDQIYLQFTQFYGKELKMSLPEIQYAVDPKQCTMRYRLYRFAASILEQSFFVLTTPFRLIYLLYQRTFAPLLALSKMVPKNPD